MTPDLIYSSDLRARLQRDLAGFSRQTLDRPGLKRAAVGIMLTDLPDGSNRTAFILTLRAPRMSSHAGQFALPGGRIDAGETAVDTVLREHHEELGHRLTTTDVLGLLDDYETRSGYVITPVVVWAGSGPSLRPNPGEVAEVHFIGLSDLVHAETVDFVSIAESDRPVIRLRLLNTFLHAPTAALLYQFAELLVGRHTRVNTLEQPVFAWR